MTASNPGKAAKRRHTLRTLTQQHSYVRNREVVFNVVLKGTGLAMLAFLALLLFSFAVVGNHYIYGRVLVCAGAVLYLFCTYLLSRSRHRAVAPFMLVAFYLALAVGTLWQWGIDIPFGILLMGLSIVLASTLLASANSLRTAVIACVTVVALQQGQAQGVLHPDLSWSTHPPSLGNAFGYCVGFSILALVSWLFARQTERSLVRAEAAEAALLEEKAMLEVRVKERTEELRQAQIEEMQQLHQFAEVGQMSTALLHDLANHLTVLTLEIEGIQSQKHATAIQRARHIISHLDTMVDGVRDRLKGQNSEHPFNLAAVISEIVDYNRYRHASSAVKIDWQKPKQLGSFQYFGDPLRLSQIVSIVVANAIDAYRQQESQAKQPTVTIMLESTADNYVIHIVDQGRGISKVQREKLFKQVSSTKKDGMGIGLYLAKQMLESQFAGTIQLASATDHTEFIISLPKERSGE